MSNISTFPRSFVWGTAISAYQTEGNNINTNWWKWEHEKPPEAELPRDTSGVACDFYNRYEEDFDLCQKLNNNAVRISIEWARVEPEENKFDEKEIEHYKRVLIAARDRGLQTFVTLHHFTDPLWFSKKGGWANVRAPYYFAKYAEKCVEEFSGLIDVYLTVNEPQVYTLQSYTRGVWPPNKESPFLSYLVQVNMIRAHRKAYARIKSKGDFTVGIVKNIVYYTFTPGRGAFIGKLLSKFMYFLNDDFFLRPLKKHTDLIGLNFYFTTRFKGFKTDNVDDVQSDLGWWVYPPGLEQVLLKLKKYDLPIYITENGVADCVDRIRPKFIRDMLAAANRAMQKGVKLKGYFYWSLLDNYEWHEGYKAKFGLVYVDRQNNLLRHPRESFYYYAEICDSGRIVV